jgi:hypothetical protein
MAYRTFSESLVLTVGSLKFDENSLALNGEVCPECVHELAAEPNSVSEKR